MIITSKEFQDNVAHYQETVRQGPIEITQEGEPQAVLMSAQLYQLLMRGRIACRVEDLDDEIVEAIANSKVPDEYAYLDDLIKDWQP